MWEVLPAIALMRMEAAILKIQLTSSKFKKGNKIKVVHIYFSKSSIFNRRINKDANEVKMNCRDIVNVNVYAYLIRAVWPSHSLRDCFQLSSIQTAVNVLLFFPLIVLRFAAYCMVQYGLL